MDLKEEITFAGEIGQHWYYSSKAAAVLALVRGTEVQHLLDVGAGSGFFSKYLLSNTNAEDAVCVDSNYPEDNEEQVGGKNIRFRKDCPDMLADLILMMDVLEHVEDDLQLLRKYSESAPVGARFLITVPAFSFLWSGHDVFLGHQRRYTLKQTVSLVRNAGLDVEHGSYFFGLVFPIAAVVRILGSVRGRERLAPRSHLKMHNPVVNALLRGMCALDRLAVFPWNRVAGLSVFCVARKKSGRPGP